MKRKRLLFLSSSLVITSAFFVASCSSDDDFLMGNGLDINSQVPLTRGGCDNDGGPAYIPKVNDQCPEWSLTKVAYNKKTKVATGNKNKDGSPEMATVGSDKYSCTKFYKKVCEINTSRYWPRCDKYGEKITHGPDANKYDQGNDTTMAPSVLREIGRELNCLDGEQEFFDTFEELQQRINSDSFNRDHKPGTYIIFNPREDNNQGHFYVGKGVEKYGDNRGNINVQDAKGNKTLSKANDPKKDAQGNPLESEKKGFVLLY